MANPEIVRVFEDGEWRTELGTSSGGGGGVTEITSDDDSVVVTNPTGPVVDLSVSGGSPPITDPTDISGLLLWLDAAQLPGAHGDPITTWPDLSGNDFDAAQATGDNKPTLDLETIPGVPFVNFDPTSNNQWLEFSGDALAMLNEVSGITFAVVIVNRDGASPSVLFGARSAAGNRLFVDTYLAGTYGVQATVINDDEAGSSYMLAQGGAFQEAGAGGWAATAGVVSFDLNTGFCSCWEGGIRPAIIPADIGGIPGRDVALNHLDPVGPTESANCTSILLSGDGGAAFNPWDGGVVGLAIYGRALKSSERRNLLDWISDTYGVA